MVELSVNVVSFPAGMVIDKGPSGAVRAFHFSDEAVTVAQVKVPVPLSCRNPLVTWAEGHR